jgi:SAM-dependent methyltransferase
MEWFENEEFWEACYPHMFRGQRFAAAPKEVDALVALSGVTSGAALDLCCGPGRHSVALARQGFAVTAVDRSPFLLAKAREHAAGAPIEFVQADMREFVRPAAFDLAISLFTSFGYFATRNEDLAVLRNVRSSLKPGGAFVIDIIGKEALAARLVPAWWEPGAEGELFIQHPEILPGWSRLRSQWLLVKDGAALRFEFECNLYSGQELLEALEGAGFSDVQLFGSLEGSPYDNHAARLVAKARAK